MSLDGTRITMLVMNDVRRDARVQKEARSAAAAGAEVTVLGVGEPESAVDFVEFELQLVPGLKSSTHPVWPVRVAQNLFGERAVDRRLAHSARHTRPDIVHCNDLNTLHIGARVARETRCRLVYDSHELFTETAGHRWWQRAILRRRERRLIGRADAVITVNPIIADELKRRYSLPATPAVVYNGPLSCRGVPAQDNSPMRLLYQGGFLGNRGLETLISVMGEFRGRCELTLQGWGPLEADLRRRVDQSGLGDIVRFLPAAAPEDLVETAAKHDVGVIVHRANSLNNKYSSPNKLFDYMGAGLAVLASDLPFLRSVLEQEECGLLFDPEVEGLLTRSISELCDDREAVARMKARSAEACVKYSWNEQVRVLVSAYEKTKEL